MKKNIKTREELNEKPKEADVKSNVKHNMNKIEKNILCDEFLHEKSILDAKAEAIYAEYLKLKTKEEKIKFISANMFPFEYGGKRKFIVLLLKRCGT